MTAAAALVAALAVAAAPPTMGVSSPSIGRHAAVQAGSAPSAAARKMVAGVVNCLANARPARLREVLDLPVGSIYFRRLIVELLGDCVDRGPVDRALAMPWLVFRAAAFEALYAREFRSAAAVDFASAGAVAYPSVETPARNARPDTSGVSRYPLVMAIGDCTVRAAPAQTRALVLSEVGSEAESAAIQALIPSLSGCIPAGQQVEISRPILRGMVAEPLYRLTRARAR